MQLRSLFTDHPASVGETYLQHMGVALGFGGRMILAGAACLIHAILPFLFTKTGSEAISTLHDRMIAHRHRAARSGAGEAQPVHRAAE